MGVTKEVQLRLREQTAEIKRLVLEKKSHDAIAAETHLPLATVRYKVRLLRAAGELPKLRQGRQSRDGAGHSLVVNGLIAACVEEVKIITCPHCRQKFQVV